MSVDLVLSQPHDFTRRQGQAVEAETARIDAVVAPGFIALGQVEELARRRGVNVEIHLQRRLLGAGERAGEVARAMEEIVDAVRKRQTAISRIWRAFGLKPHQTEAFKLSPDPLFIDKVRDIIGLYLNPPDAAVMRR